MSTMMWAAIVIMLLQVCASLVLMTGVRWFARWVKKMDETFAHNLLVQAENMELTDRLEQLQRQYIAQQAHYPPPHAKETASHVRV